MKTRPARIATALVGLASTGLLLFGAFVFLLGLCAPDDCAQARIAGWTLTGFAALCAAAVWVVLRSATRPGVRVVAALVIAVGLVVGVGLLVTI